MKSLKAIVDLEKKIEQERIELAKDYIVDKQINPAVMSDADILAFYTFLVTKAQKWQKETLDNLLKE